MRSFLRFTQNELKMKKILFCCLIAALSVGAKAQLVPLQVYNGTTTTLIVHSVAVLGTLPPCAPGGTSAAVGIAIPPGGIITIAPLLPGNGAVDWAAAKISNIGGTVGIGAVHPYFAGCFGAGGPWGFPVLTDYWYGIGSTPTQVLKIY